MAPVYGFLNYEFEQPEDDLIENAQINENSNDPTSLTEMAFWYMMVLIVMLLIWLVLFFFLRIIAMRQKTRNPQQRRMYVGSRPRPSLGQAEPTIFVSPSNLPPPPKYECMAPPSYEEVVGIHYPNYQIQPITQPISTALAQGSAQGTNSRCNETAATPETVINVAAEPSRTSATVARS